MHNLNGRDNSTVNLARTSCVLKIGWQGQLLGGLMLHGMLLVALWFHTPLKAAVAQEQNVSESYQQIVVQPGDTLWEISTRLAQDNNRASVLDQIMAYNNLETSELEVGQTLYVPFVQDQLNAH